MKNAEQAAPLLGYACSDMPGEDPNPADDAPEIGAGKPCSHPDAAHQPGTEQQGTERPGSSHAGAFQSGAVAAFLAMAQQQGVGPEAATAITLSLAVGTGAMTPRAAADALTQLSRALGHQPVESSAWMGDDAGSEDATADADTQASQPARHNTPSTPSTPITFSPIADEDGLQRINAVAWNRDVLLYTTRGTRWDAWGVEHFENGFYLHLCHADDPYALCRVITWPPKIATFDSFAEAMDMPRFQEELRARDAAARANPPDAAATPRNFESYLDAFRRGDEADRYEEMREASARPWFAGREDLDPPVFFQDEESNDFCLRSNRAEKPVFDLSGTPWRSAVLRTGDDWRVILKHAEAEGVDCSLVLRPSEGTGDIEGVAAGVKLRRLQEVVRNASLMHTPEAFRQVIEAAALPRTPVAVAKIPLWRGWSLELWPGVPDAPTPFLHPVLKDSRGAAIIDCRHTRWGCAVRASQMPDAVDIRFTIRDVRERPLDAEHARWLTLHIPSRRLVMPEGRVPFSRLRVHVHESMAWRILVENLEADAALSAGCRCRRARPHRTGTCSRAMGRGECF